jgi:fluoride ion exporter CrcB/FEX
MIWVAIGIGSVLAATARQAGLTGANLLPDLGPTYRHLRNQRLDGFLVGVIIGLPSHLVIVLNQPRQSMAAIGLCAAFAVFSTLDGFTSTMGSDDLRPGWSCVAREASLGMVAALAGWLIASARWGIG